MKRAILTAVCAVAASAVVWGCGGPAGTDAQTSGGMEGTGAQESDLESADEDRPGSSAVEGSAAEKGSAAEGSAADQDNAAESSAAAKDNAAAQGSAAEKENAADGSQAGQSSGVQLAGASISILGDSISTYQGCNPVGYYAFFPENGEVAEVEDTWWHQVTEDLELTLYVNGSSSGATVAGDSTGTEDPQCGCNELRTNDLSGPAGACPDMIVIYLGTNDMMKAVPLGDNDGTGLVEEGMVETFSDAYTLMLDKVQANYPLADIYCCTLLPVGDYGTETPYVEFVNGKQLTSADYGEVVSEIAQTRGLAVIDLYNCGVTVENLQEMTSDGVHPTAAGMDCIAEAVKAALAARQPDIG